MLDFVFGGVSLIDIFQRFDHPFNMSEPHTEARIAAGFR